MRPHETVPYDQWIERSPEEMATRAADFYEEINRRRTTRYFRDRAVPREVIETCLKAAGTAPSGANHQPWHFTVIESAAIKAKVRSAAEEEERIFYRDKAPQEWLDALAPLGTDDEAAGVPTPAASVRYESPSKPAYAPEGSHSENTPPSRQGRMIAVAIVAVCVLIGLFILLIYG